MIQQLSESRATQRVAGVWARNLQAAGSIRLSARSVSGDEGDFFAAPEVSFDDFEGRRMGSTIGAWPLHRGRGAFCKRELTSQLETELPATARDQAKFGTTQLEPAAQQEQAALQVVAHGRQT